VEKFLEELATELRAGEYVAPVVRRKYILKADGRQRPLGIPTVSANYPGCRQVFGMG
jgi:RNA-directed DNA polymerase